MTFLDRFISAVLALFCLAVAVVVLAVAFGWDAAQTAAEVAAVMRLRPWETGLSALVLLLAAAHVLAAALPHEREKAIVRETPLGQVRVSLRAIENAVYRSVREVKGVRDVDARVNTQAGDTSVSIRVGIAVAAGVAIPDLADEVQHGVERYIQDTVGIPVSAVVVEVKAVTGESKARVE